MRISGYIYKYLHQLKKLFDNLFRINKYKNGYYLVLDGYYYCNSKKCMVVVIRVNYKRTSEKIPICEIVNDKNYLKELHPFHAFIIGILANNERNGLIDENCIGLKNLNRVKNCYNYVKSAPILSIVGTYLDCNNNKITVLKSKFLDKKIDVISSELYVNQYLLCSIDSLQALAIGYEASESIIQNL